MNDETRDQALSRLYREGAWPEPSRQIDQAILAASRRASRQRHPFLWRFAPPLAIAATVVLTSAIVLRVYREQPAMVESSAQEKPAGGAMQFTERGRQFTPEPKASEAKRAEQTAADTKSATPPAAEPQAAPTPQGFSSTMDASEAARLERAQRDLGLKELSPAGAQPAAKPAFAAPAAKASPQPLKKESPQTAAPSAERRADAPQTPTTNPTFSVFGASPPPAAAQAPAQAPRAATGKPAQALTLSAPPAAPRPEAVQAAPNADAAPAPPSGADFNAIAARSAVTAAIVAPAAAAKPERTPQAWIDDIRKLMREGKSEEAGEEIAKFKKRYPDYVLPEDLR